MDTVTDRRLGRAALFVTALLILTVAVTAVIARRPRGEIEIPAAWRSQADYTLIIFGRKSCPACAASSAFHRKLSAAAEANGVRVVAALTSNVETPDAFAASIGVAPDHALRANPAPRNLKSVPTVIVVNRDGELLKKTEGALSVEQQRAFMSFVTTLR